MASQALIVDDSKTACKILANMLQSFDVQSTSVFSAEEAIGYLKNNKPDVIFIDHDMPEMDGLEAVKVFKSDPQTATIPVMMHTSREGELYVSQARALGAVDVLPKGVEKRLLRENLRKLGLIEQPAESQPVTEAKAENNPPKIPETEPVSVSGQAGDIWFKQIKPFLSQSNIQQAEVLRSASRDQSRMVVKDFHKTLESFEYALVSEMHSQRRAVIHSMTRQVKALMPNWILLAAIVLFVQLLVFWQLWEVQDLTQRLINTQNELIERLEEHDLQVDRRVNIETLELVNTAAEKKPG